MIVDVQRRGRILVIAMQRPEKRNAVNRELAVALSEAFDTLDDDDELWVGVLTGTPDVFSAGTDLSGGADATTERGGEYGLIRRQRRKPLIAAVEGPAFGGGFEIALACDMVVASTTARFALPESRRGLIPSSGALFRAIRALPLHVAKQLMITGAELTAERAQDLGVVNEVTPPGAALDAAIALAEDVCLSSPVAVQAILAGVAAQLEPADAAGWAATSDAVDKVMSSADLQEGIDAFFGRRPPEWTGR
ncbi:enoyl-CoA hydratase-related protein [Mycolicibacterium arenosum]|uniref:Enoyl-CoA hydratase-related protein n=1 Tax=Mycolicibacterium arenosum TaxID=2952157 RepID=A0ABT1MCF1_9MYCO|nr:enoyl-CoA hydratase-related protein [Mycolicibacterium sp. CAU 1645]MCP9276844.1 enoyl-CoA hydratase-related protein [Mycolicibacterium sp. CAU 1645]